MEKRKYVASGCKPPLVLILSVNGCCKCQVSENSVNTVVLTVSCFSSVRNKLSCDTVFAFDSR